VRLGAVLGEEHLAVLERAHRSRIDVDVRVELEIGDADAAGSEDCGERGGGDALPERGDDATRYKHELGHGRQVQEIAILPEGSTRHKPRACMPEVRVNARRKLLVAASAVLLTTPLASLGQQQSQVARIGYLAGRSLTDNTRYVQPLRESLHQPGSTGR